jgi:UTP--glucose-1-phosphate uridylyltransferase
MKLLKAVIPAAGLGTRFLPITKVVPKELLPILEKPAIHYVVKEALDAGVQECCFILSEEKHMLTRYFLPTTATLQKAITAKHLSALDQVDDLIARSSYAYIYQDTPRGLGHAVLLARDFIGDDDFFSVLLPDDIIASDVPGLAQLMDIAFTQQALVVAVIRVPQDQLSAYGVIEVQEQISERVFRVRSMVEKPQAHDAPSDLAIIGRYILSPAIFDALESVKATLTAGELQLTDAIAQVIRNGHPVYACLIDGHRFDTGTPMGWLHTNNYYAGLRS